MARPYIWTEYLSKVSSEWKSRVGQGTSVDWPVGVAATGDNGVSQKIREVKGAVGYFELSYAQKRKIPFGSVKSADGSFVAASLERVSIDNASRTNAYPIATFTWILVPVRARNSETKKALKEFLAWIVTDGQKYTIDLYCSPLPTEVADEAPTALDESH